jgi:hypothetical protein
MMSKQPTEQTLAIHGGPKALSQIEGISQPKIGVEEFLSIAERFGFSSDALSRIRSTILDDDLGPGPNLAKNQWYTSNDCRKTAAGINKVLSAYCTQDPTAISWT